MRFLAALVVPLLLAGCASMSVDRSSSTVTSPETLYEGSVDLGSEPQASAAITFDVPANTSQLDVQIGADNAVNLRAEGPGCTTSSGAGNVQVGVANRQTANMRCDAPPAGSFTITLARDAGSGDVDVIVTGLVTRES